MADQDPARKAPPWGRGAILSVAAAAMVGTAALTALLVNIMERKQEAKNPFFRVVELTDETEDPEIWGKNFPIQYDTYKRTVDQKRTRFGGSEALPQTPDRGRPALDRRAVPARGGPAPQDHVGGLRLLRGLPEEARPRLHARGPDLHRARAGVQAARHVHPLPRVRLRALQEGRGRRPRQGLRALQPDALHRGAQELHPPDRLHRLPRPADHGAADHPARVPRGHQGAEGEPGHRRLRRQHPGDPPGDAQLRLRAVPRRVLLQGRREAAHLPLAARG